MSLRGGRRGPRRAGSGRERHLRLWRRATAPVAHGSHLSLLSLHALPRLQRLSGHSCSSLLASARAVRRPGALPRRAVNALRPDARMPAGGGGMPQLPRIRLPSRRRVRITGGHVAAATRRALHQTRLFPRVLGRLRRLSRRCCGFAGTHAARCRWQAVPVCGSVER